MSERLLTAEELAERLGVPPKWPLQQARAGNLPHLKLGRYTRFDAHDVDAWLETVKAGGGPRFRRDGPRPSEGV